jgi:hypothetical protein
LSIAFFKTPGTLWLYSAVMRITASASRCLAFHALTIGSEWVGSAKSPIVS